MYCALAEEPVLRGNVGSCLNDTVRVFAEVHLRARRLHAEIGEFADGAVNAHRSAADHVHHLVGDGTGRALGQYGIPLRKGQRQLSCAAHTLHAKRDGLLRVVVCPGVSRIHRFPAVVIQNIRFQKDLSVAVLCRRHRADIIELVSERKAHTVRITVLLRQSQVDGDRPLLIKFEEAVPRRRILLRRDLQSLLAAFRTFDRPFVRQLPVAVRDGGGISLHNVTVSCVAVAKKHGCRHAAGDQQCNGNQDPDQFLSHKVPSKNLFPQYTFYCLNYIPNGFLCQAVKQKIRRSSAFLRFDGNSAVLLLIMNKE